MAKRGFRRLSKRTSHRTRHSELLQSTHQALIEKDRGGRKLVSYFGTKVLRSPNGLGGGTDQALAVFVFPLNVLFA